jgi:hypothetical protein
MPFLRSIDPAHAEGDAHELYQKDLEKKGYLSNYTRAYSLRPAVLEAWRALQGSIRRNMRLRRYELVTFAAATALHCTY